jgi:hypothetical protein
VQENFLESQRFDVILLVPQRGWFARLALSFHERPDLDGPGLRLRQLRCDLNGCVEVSGLNVQKLDELSLARGSRAICERQPAVHHSEREGATEIELRRRLADMLLGEELARKVYGEMKRAS